jgi:hypothetical protein
MLYIRDMKNAYIFLLSLLFFKTAFCQINIGSAKTANHINIPGTKIWLIPAADFQLTDRYKGFNNKSDPFSSILLNELPAAYENFAGAFSKTGPTANNINIVAIEKCNVPSATGCTLITATQTAQGYTFGKHMLLFGDQKASTMITATYLKDSVKTGEKLKNAIKTLYFDEHQTIDVRASVGYTFDESGSIFKFESVMGTTISFTSDPANSNAAEKTRFIAAKAFSNVNIPDKKQFCLQRVKQLPYQNIEIDTKKGVNEVEIDGLKGYELYATGVPPKESGKELLHQIILFDQDSYYIMVAMYNRPTEEKISTTNQFAKTFKRKPVTIIK